MIFSPRSIIMTILIRDSDRLLRRLSWILTFSGNATLFVGPGNHDVGTMHTVSSKRLKAFEEALGPANRVMCYKNVSFVTYNTQVMGPFSPTVLQEEAKRFISAQTTRDAVAACSGKQRPILMQHMPMFRLSDAACGDGRDACAAPTVATAAAHPRASPRYCRRTEGGTTYKGRQESLVAWHDDVLDKPATDWVGCLDCCRCAGWP